MNETMGIKADMDKWKATVLFWSVAGFFAAFWVLLPTLLHTSYCGDVIEVLNIAPEWVWATKKHPMLPAWMLEILILLTNRSFAVPFIATQLCTILTLWSVWKLGRTVLDERLALIGALSILPYTFFAVKPIWFNQNNILIALWTLSIYLVFQAFQTNKKRWWIAAGIALGLTFQAKYSAVFLVVAILTYMFTRQEGRKYIWTPGPYITTLIAFVIFLPHIIWLCNHDFITFDYVSRAESKHVYFLSQWSRHIFSPFHFVILQFLYLPLTTIIVLPVIGYIWKWKVQHHKQGKVKECEKFLFYCFMIPFVLHLFYGGGKGAYLCMAYGAPFWACFGLWLLLRFQQSVIPIQKSFRLVLVLTFTIMLLIATGFVTLSYLGLQHSKHYLPMRELGTTCEDIWHSRFPDVACPYMAGNNILLAGHVAHAMTVRPSLIMPQGTWATDDNLNQKGGMIVWELDENETNSMEALRTRFPKAEVLPEILELPYKTGAKIPPLRLGIAVVPPARP